MKQGFVVYLVVISFRLDTSGGTFVFVSYIMRLERIVVPRFVSFRPDCGEDTAGVGHHVT